MNITAILLLVGCLQVSARGSSQVVTLNVKNARLDKVFEEIKKQTGYTFMYTETMLRESKRVSMNVKNLTLQSILTICFASQPFTYEIINQTVVVQPKEKTVVMVNSVMVLPPAEIHGRVVNQKGEPLQNISVIIEGTKTGTTTDKDGSFILDVPDNKNIVLEISSIGYQTQRVKVGKQTEINVTMEPKVSELNEVVAIGYGTVKKSNLTGSVSKVSSRDIEDRVVPRIDEALQGKMPGVRIQSISGLPGAAPVVRIRGTNSITEGNQPLWVIDGMPIEEAKFIGNLNMNDVESIEVLKDAASAAIYGSRGANGVILVTSKKGKAGSPKISYSMYYGKHKEEKRLAMLTGPEEADYLVERRTWQLTNFPQYNANTPNDMLPANLRIDPDWRTGNVPTYNFQDFVFRSAPIQNHNVSFSGGTDKTTYFASMNYMDNQGTMTNTSFDKYSFRINVESQIQKRIKIGLNLSPSFSTQSDNNSEGKDQTLTGMAYTSPLMSPADTYWNESGKVWTNDYAKYCGLPIPGIIYRLNNLNQEYKRNQIFARAFIDVSIMEGLNARSELHYIQSNMKFNDYEDTRLAPAFLAAANTNLATEYNTNLNWENTLNYAKNIGKHSINGLVGYSMQNDFVDYRSLQAVGFPTDITLTLNNAARISTWNQDIQKWSMISMFARAQYSYNSRYLLSASLRRDGSSRFGSENKWGSFPAVSVGWVVSEESFMKSQKLFSTVKLRGSYGATGNNRIGNYRSFATLNSVLEPLGSNETLVGGLVPGSIANNKLTWEKNNTVNLGLDAAILNNRVMLTLDVYNSNTDGLLLAVPIPTITGFNTAIQNIGKVNNKGIEIGISTHNIRTSNFTWNTSFNVDFTKNKVLELGPDGAPIGTGPFWATSSQFTAIGHPIGSFYLFQADGIFHTQAEVDKSARYGNEGVGDVKWVDQNNDGKVDDKDRKIMGQPTPKCNFGFTNTFRYKNFDLSLFINGSGGNYTYFGWFRYISRTAGQINMAEWLNRWRSPSEPGNGIMPRVTSDAATNGTVEENSRVLYKSDWWRIKNVTLGYNLPASTLQKLKISSLRFYVTGDNLLLKTKYLGYNPEGGLTFAPNQGTSQREAFTASSGLGYDFGSSPLPKSIIVGLNITF